MANFTINSLPTGTPVATDNFLKSDASGALTKVPYSTLKTAIAPLTTNLLAETPGTGLDATQGKILDDKITSLNGSLTGKLNKLVASTTGSFNSEAIYQYANNVLENIRTNIGNYTTGIHSIDSNGGPMYGVILYKYSNTLWCALLYTYSTTDLGYFYAKCQNETCWVMRIY